MGVAILVLEILLLSKTPKFPFPTMDYSPWSSNNLIIWNRLKKIMQVEVNVLCMHTNFDGCRHSGFLRYCYFQKRPNFPFRPWTISMVIKKFNLLELAQKIMQVEVNVLSMHTNFDGCRHFGFEDIATFKNAQISLSDHGL